LLGTVTVTNGFANILNNSGGAAVATCPEGTVAIGGGYGFAPTDGMTVYYYGPGAAFANYQAVVFNTSGTDRQVEVFAYCAAVTIDDQRAV
jgi:hypothetical protein